MLQQENNKIYFEFIKNRAAFYAVAAVVLIGIPILLLVRPLNYGMDFRGGTEFLVRFDKPIDEEHIRTTLEKPEFKDLGDVQVFKVTNAAGEPNFSIRTKMQPDQLGGMSDKVPRVLSKDGNACKLLSTNSVGPVVGETLKRNTLKAIFWSIIVILIYMSIQFEFRPGVLATIALLHDTFTVLGLFSITQGEVDLTVVAAILTVLGYSMNDSIVILDRIRENLRLKRKTPIDELVNLSINQCLGRTLYTGITVMLTLFTLFLMGPAVLRNFALAMIVGILSGTISTVTVVCPLLVDWTLWERSGGRGSTGAVLEKAIGIDSKE
jgi:preprotein translocase subunit SecF